MSTTAVSFLRSSPFRWAAGGWSFFIVENLILSENRTWLIERLGDDGYHAAYGTLSSVAMGSVGYAYFRKVRNTAPFLWQASVATPMPHRIGAWICLSLGLTMASQAFPKAQIPVALTADNSLQVRCPFDFHAGKNDSEQLYGLERISRHAGLWSFGLIGLGQSFLAPSLPQRIWLGMPLLVALIGGAHTDSRYRRGLGGELTKEYDSVTSNVPFAALVQQGGWKELANEIKPLNALLATGIATVWVMRRGGGVSKSMMKSIR